MLFLATTRSIKTTMIDRVRRKPTSSSKEKSSSTVKGSSSNKSKGKKPLQSHPLHKWKTSVIVVEDLGLLSNCRSFMRRVWLRRTGKLRGVDSSIDSLLPADFARVLDLAAGFSTAGGFTSKDDSCRADDRVLRSVIGCNDTSKGSRASTEVAVEE